MVEMITFCLMPFRRSVHCYFQLKAMIILQKALRIVIFYANHCELLIIYLLSTFSACVPSLLRCNDNSNNDKTNNYENDTNVHSR